MPLEGGTKFVISSSVTIVEQQTGSAGKNFAVLWLVFFFQGMTPGFWMPSLTNILANLNLSSWVAVAFMVPPLCALVSPLIGGALADQRVAANRLIAWSSLISSVILYAAFWTLDHQMNPWWFIILLGIYSLISGPSWGLLATISLTHLSHGERQYPLVRMAATIGWVAAGLIASYVMRADLSPASGYAGSGSRALAGLIALLLPLTPPLGRGTSWKSLLGFDAFALLKQRDHLVFFLVTALFSIPLAAFYMYAPEQFRWLGNDKPAATMTIGQISEIVGMLIVGSVMTRFRIKTILLAALGLSVVRYGLSGYAGYVGIELWHIWGVALHGICYTFYFITAQVFLDRRVEPGMRGQAQGLLGLVSGGVGPFAGAWVCSWVHRALVDGSGQGWLAFWGVLAAMILACFVIFAVFYRGIKRTPTNG